MSELIEKVKANHLFLNLDIEKILEVFPKKNSIFKREGEVIYSKGQPADSVYLLLSGKINFLDYNFVDRSKIKERNRIINENEFFGYDEISSNTLRTSTTIALTNSELFQITTNELDLIVRKNIRILENLSKSVLGIGSAKQQISSNVPADTGSPVPMFSFKKKVSPLPRSAKTEPEHEYPDDIKKLLSSLEKEKQFAEKAIEEEMNEISKKEKELSLLEESLSKEKMFAEEELSKEFSDLQKKEEQIALLEKSIKEQKLKAEKFISNKLKAVKIKEIELEKKANSFQENQKLLNEALEKTKDIAAKEMELLKKARQIEKEREHLNIVKAKEEELKKKEAAIENMLKEIELERQRFNISSEKESELFKKEEEIKNKMLEINGKEKSIDEIAKREQELAKKEEELLRMGRALENEKMFAEKTLKTEMEELSRKEEELKQKEANLKREKELSELTLQKELQELEEKEKQIITPPVIPEIEEKDNSELEYYKSQINELKEKEDRLLKKIEELEQEKLEQVKSPPPEPEPEIESGIIVEPEIILESEVTTEELEEPIPQQLEEELQEEIPEIKKSDPVERPEPEPIFEDDDEQEDFISVSISPSINFIIERNFQNLFQVYEYEDITIVLVNIQRGTANFSSEFRSILTNALDRGARKVVIDISYSDYLDSTFLGVMVSFLKKITYEGGTLHVVLDVTKMTSSTFFLSGMDRVFNIFENVGQAVRKFDE